MKRMTSKEILAESFRELATKKKISRITIKDITDNCGYSTATFYRNFKDKYDLIAWAYSTDVEEIMKKVDYTEASWKTALTEAAEYYRDHREYLSNLLLHSSGYTSFLQNMAQTNYQSLKKKIQENSYFQAENKDADLYSRMYCYGAVALTCDWLLGKFDADAETLAQIYENALPRQLRPYLFKPEKNR